MIPMSPISTDTEPRSGTHDSPRYLHGDISPERWRHWSPLHRSGALSSLFPMASLADLRAQGLGMLVAAQMNTRALDYYYKRWKAQNNGVGKPEFRLRTSLF